MTGNLIRAGAAFSVLLVASCGRADEPNDVGAITAEDSGQIEQPSAADAVTAKPAMSYAYHEIADEDLVILSGPADMRMANAYAFDVSMGEMPSVCDAALHNLNKPFAAEAQISEAAKPPRERAIAAARRSAALAIGAADNVRWTRRTHALGPGLVAESAFVDFFNDGVTRLVIRQAIWGAAGPVVNFSVRTDSGDPQIESLSFEALAADPAAAGLPFESVVADLAKIDERYYSLVAPVDADGDAIRVLLVDWLPAPGVDRWRRAGDFAPSITCAFVPAGDVAVTE